MSAGLVAVSQYTWICLFSLGGSCGNQVLLSVVYWRVSVSPAELREQAYSGGDYATAAADDDNDYEGDGK